MEKKVFIKSYEGNVIVKCSKNTGREDVKNIAKYALGEHLGKIITSLSNLEYIVESDPKFYTLKTVEHYIQTDETCKVLLVYDPNEANVDFGEYS